MKGTRRRELHIVGCNAVLAEQVTNAKVFRGTEMKARLVRGFLIFLAVSAVGTASF